MRARVRDARGATVVHDFVHTIVPIHDENGKVDGIVVYSQTVQNGEVEKTRAKNLKEVND